MPRFSIIIVSWNALDHLQTFLPSVAETDYPSYEIILADNASDDGSVEWVSQAYPGVKIASLDKNYGYCGGNNRAVPHADGEILVFLNNDVKVEPDWLKPLDRCFGDDPALAALQPKMLSFNNPDEFEYAGAAGGMLDKYGYPFCRGRIFDSLEEDRGQYDQPAPIFWASGAALCVRKEIFEDAGGFDEDFEFHMEEIDLCWRLWNRGYKVGYCPKSVVYHLGGGSLPMDSPRKTYYNYRNNLAMIWKNYTSSSLLTRFLGRLVLDGIAAIKELMSGRFRVFAHIFKAHMHFYRSWPAIHRKRGALQKERDELHNPPVMTNRSIVYQYFIRGRKKYSDLPDS